MRCAAIIVYGVMTESAKKKPMLGGYLAQLQDARGRERYIEKLAVIGGVDLYEIPRKDWTDDVDLWPAITYVHVGMYLVLSPSPYTSNDLLNYKNLDCYVNFISGFVREVLVKEICDKRAVIAKVSRCNVLKRAVNHYTVCLVGKSLAEVE